ALIPILLALLIPPLVPAQKTQPLLVTSVHFWSLADMTRVAIETNGPFRYRSDRLEHPDRLFFDLLGAKPRMAERGMHTTPVDDTLLKRIRVAETQPGVTRVVLDLEASVEFHASQLSNPDRLVIEVRLAKAGGGEPTVISSAKSVTSVTGADK